MTKKEFYLKSIISMAGNANYVEVKPFEDTETITHTLLTEEILMDADRLMRETENEWPDAFDKEPASGESFTIGEHLQNIREAIESLEGELERQYDNEHM